VTSAKRRTQAFVFHSTAPISAASASFAMGCIDRRSMARIHQRHHTSFPDHYEPIGDVSDSPQAYSCAMRIPRQNMELGMTTKDDPEIFALIVSEYTPYDGFEEFHEGFVDFEHGLHHNPYDALLSKDTQAQAWHYGQEAAMRYVQAIGRT
jgi:hypothetical protein